MQRTGVFMTLSLLGVLSGSATATAATNAYDNDHAIKKFSINATDPSNPDPSSDPSASNNQAPRSIPRATVQPVPLTPREKFRYYLRSTYGPSSFAYTFAGSWINQARDMVPEWGQGTDGYAHRFASSFGQKIIKNTIRLGLVDMMHEDPRYFASSRSGIWSRAKYAIGQTFISHLDSGGTRPAYSRFIASFAASYAAHQWYPDTYHSAGDYLSGGFISIAIDVGKNVWSEFWPDVRRKLHH